MNRKNVNRDEQNATNLVEDLTLSETAAQNVKGGPFADTLLRLDGIKGESGDHK